MGGHVDGGFFAGLSVIPQVRAHKRAALAVAGAWRSPLPPEVANVAEADDPGFAALC